MTTTEMVWVPALDEHPENEQHYFLIYSPYHVNKDHLYTGKDALPHFITFQECEDWCVNTNQK